MVLNELCEKRVWRDGDRRGDRLGGIGPVQQGLFCSLLESLDTIGVNTGLAVDDGGWGHYREPVME